MTLKDLIIHIVITLIAVWLVGYFVSNRQDSTTAELKEYWENKDFKTDSQEVYIDYSKVPFEKFVNYVPPAVNIKYIDSTKTYNTSTKLIASDSLLAVVDSLEGVITEISRDFLLNYPEAPKLIQALISKDTVILDLLKIDGNFTRDIYPVNFSKFSYQYTNNEFRANRVDAPTTILNPLSIYSGLTYDWFNSSPAVWGSIDYGYNRWVVRGYSAITLSQVPLLQIHTGIGYRLNRWEKE